MSKYIDWISFIVTASLLLISAITDLKYRKVKNIFTFPSMGIGLFLTGIQSIKELLVRVIWICGMFIVSTFGVMGMGDVKLIMAIIALRGYWEALLCVLFGSIAMILYCLITERTLMIESLKDTFRFLIYRTHIPKRSDKKYPFAFFMALGYPAAWFLSNLP